VLEEHKRIYRQVRSSLDDGKPVTLDHDMTTGEVIITDGAADADADHYIETLQPARRLCIFGATPLAGQLVRILQAMHFSIHISDWREGYLATLKDLPQVTMHLSTWPVDAEAFALVMSHNHERDLESLRSALSVGCRYVGLLSSISRRDHILQQLGEEGFSDEQLAAVHSPVGIDIHGRSDAEIATSIVAQLIQVKNR
jgi:xanthine dehydrogenase accessory factor